MDLVQALDVHSEDNGNISMPKVFDVHGVLMDTTTILSAVLHDYQFSEC